MALINIKVTDRDGQKHQLNVRTDDHLMDALREPTWGVAAICGGMCSCATCHVYVDEPWLEEFPEKDTDEQDLVEFLDFAKENSRLSCQLFLQPRHEGLSVTLAPEE